MRVGLRREQHFNRAIVTNHGSHYFAQYRCRGHHGDRIVCWLAIG